MTRDKNVREEKNGCLLQIFRQYGSRNENKMNGTIFQRCTTINKYISPNFLKE